MLSAQAWLSSRHLLCSIPSSSSTTTNACKNGAQAYKSPFSVGLASTPRTAPVGASKSPFARFVHTSPRAHSEDLYDFSQHDSATPKRRKSSSQAKNASVRSTSSTTRRSHMDITENTATPFRKWKRAHEDASKAVQERKGTPNPRFSLADLHRYRGEAEQLEFVPISQNPLITETQVVMPPRKRRSGDKSTIVGSELLTSSIKRNIMPTVVIDEINPKYGVDKLAIKAAVRPGNATDEDHVVRAKAIAEQLHIPYFDTAAQLRQQGDIDFCLVVTSHHLSLMNLEDPLSPHVFADFITGATAHRKSTGGADPKSPIMRAVTVSGKSIGETHLLDATGGLGVDAFMFASAGFNVTILEKNALVYTLLSDAVQRARQVSSLETIMSRISLHHCDAMEWFSRNASSSNSPDVVYLDPMYPIESKMKAAPKKGMALARALVGKVDRADDLVRAGLMCAKEKVVLKRPYYSPESLGTSTAYKSRSLRFEVFTRESWSKIGDASLPRVFSPHRAQLL